MENFQLLILDTLRNASSQNPELIKLAEQQLKCLELEKGFYTTLLAVIADKTIDVHIRWLSAVYLKNGVERNWRRASANSVPNEEKEILKQWLLTCFDEPVNQIASQIALTIAKIARLDCFRDWPELFPTLLNVIQLPEDVQQQRALMTLHHVIKTLASKRLASDRKLFQQLTANLFNRVLQFWVNYSNTFLQESKNSMANHKLLLEKCLYCLKILKKLVVYGFKDPSKEPDAVNMFSYIFLQLKPFLECRKSMFGQDSLVESCEKYLILLVKILRDVLEQHPFAFIQFIRPSLECAITFCFTKEYNDMMFERLTVQLLNLIKTILQCQEYKAPKCIENTKNPLTLDAQRIKNEFFTYPILREVVDQLLSRYFLLSENDLKRWQETPEEFACEEGSESWKFCLRPCTEVLFAAIFREYSDFLVPLVLEAQRNIQNSKSTDLMSILKKDAVYNAIGLAGFELYNEVDFNQWFKDQLIPELRIKENNYYIIRRRIIWLIGEWIGIKLSQDMRPTLYEVLVQVLKTEDDIMIRLAAANTLKIATDDIEFNTEQFTPYLESSISTLFQLLKEVQECDLKMSVLHVLSFIIERIGKHVRPHAEALMHYLPQLWDSCGEHNLLRCAIISCFVHLVHGLGPLSENLYPFLLPMIVYGTDVTLPAHVYLLEDGLDLWWAILDNTSSCSPQLLSIAQNLLPILEFGSENLKKCLEIIDGYIILSPKAFFERYGQALVKTFSDILKDMLPEAIVCVMRVVETVLIVFPVEGPVVFKSVLSSALTLILQDEAFPIALSVYLSLIARVILNNQNCFGTLLQEKALETKQSAEEIFQRLLHIWLTNMNLINPRERQKLLGLALASLLTSGSSIVHHHICAVLLSVVEVLNDISFFSTEFPYPEVQDDDDYAQFIEDTEHEKRKKELLRSDPAHSVVLKDYLHSQITLLKESVGSNKFEDLMSTVDVETMQQLKSFFEVERQPPLELL